MIERTTQPPLEKGTKTVLIADDNAISRKCLKSHLESFGYRIVAEVADGEKAVEEAKKHRPSLILLDIKMPRMGGIEAARIITNLSPVPIILITGHASEELAEEAAEAGVFAYLVKPVTRKHLLPAIKLAFTRFEEFKRLEEEVADLREALEARKLIEKAKGILMKRCKIDEEAAYRLLQTHSQKENRKMHEIAKMIIEASKLI